MDNANCKWPSAKNIAGIAATQKFIQKFEKKHTSTENSLDG